MELADFLSIWFIIRKRLWLIALLVASTVAGIVVLSFFSPPVYSASVKFEVTAPPPVDVTLYQGAGGRSLTEEMIRTRDSFIDVLNSESVAREVIETLQLSMKVEELQSQSSVTEVIPDVTSKTKIDRHLLRIEVQNPDPQLAADIANALIQTALTTYGEVRAKSKTMSEEFIAAQLDTTEQELGQAQEALIAFQIENSIGDLEQAISLQQNLIFDLRKNHDLAQARGELGEVERYDQLILERETELQDLVRLDLGYTDLQAKVEQASSTYEFLLEKQTEAILKENEIRSLGFIQIISTASPPSSALPRVKMSILAVGTILSLVLGIVIAFVWDRFEAPSTESAEQVRPYDQSSIPTT